MIKTDKQDLDTFYVLGISVRTANSNGQAAKDIPALWTRFIQQDIPSKIESKLTEDIFCVYTDYEGDHTLPYTTVIGCKVGNDVVVPEGMQLVEIQGGNFLKHTAKGDLMKGLVFEAWTNIWNSALPRAYRADFEQYNHASGNADDAVVSIYLSAQP